MTDYHADTTKVPYILEFVKPLPDSMSLASEATFNHPALGSQEQSILTF